MEEDAGFPDREELTELQRQLELAGEPDEKQEDMLQMAAVNRRYFEKMLTMYKRYNAAQTGGLPGEYEPYPDTYTGEFLLGTDPDNRPVGITRRQLNEHMLITGRSGAGKTTLFYNLIDRCNEKDVPVMVFDFKRDYRHVADELDLTVISWRDLKFNPLQSPPGVGVDRWAEALADTWAHAMGVFVASKGYFLRKLRQLYHLYEDEIADGVYPSLFELRDLVRNDEIPRASPRYNYKERLENRTTMLTGFSGDIFDCSRGQPFDELVEENVVLELQEPMADTQILVVETLLMWLFLYRDAQGHRQGLRHVVMMDEAKQVFDVHREENRETRQPPITALMGRVREFGEALVVADHEPSKLSDSLKANTSVKLWMSLGSGHDVQEMAETFGVEDEQVEFARGLDRGEAVVSVTGESPVPVELPPYHVDKTGEPDGEDLSAVVDSLPWEERVRPDRFQLAIGEDPDRDNATGDDALDEDEADDHLELDLGAVAEALLASVNDKPFLSMSERYDAIGAGSKQGNAAKTELLDLELVDVVEVDTRKPGRNPKLLALTQAGEQALERRGYEVVETGRRSVEHRYWQQQIKEYYEADGFAVEIEYSVGQERIDVYAERGDVSVAVEVARSPEHEVENVRKCVAFGVDRVEVVYLSDGVRERIERAVREELGEVPAVVEFVSVSEFA